MPLVNLAGVRQPKMSFSQRCILTLFLVCGLGVLGWALGRSLTSPNTRNEFQIASGSMAPRLFGPHFAVVCSDCQAAYHCSVEQAPRDGMVVCPYCGKRGSINELTASPGHRVSLYRMNPVDRLGRGAIAVFKNATEPNLLETKRVVGLPHESIRIADGELYINDELHQKGMLEFLDQCVLIFDSDFQPQKQARWNVGQDSGWSYRAERYGFQPKGISTKSSTSRDGTTPDVNNEAHAAWLTYEHWRGIASPLPRDEQSPVLDHYGANQSTSRELHVVSDLMLQLDAKVSEPATLSLKLSTAGHHVIATWSFLDQSFRLEIDGSEVHRNPFNYLAEDCERFRLALLDGRVLVGVSDQTLVVHSLTERTADEPNKRGVETDRTNESGQVAAIGAQLGRIQIENIRLYRDVYYLEPNLTKKPWSIQLGSDEYCLLGDNVAVSNDSRRLGPIKRARIVGIIPRLSRLQGELMPNPGFQLR